VHPILDEYGWEYAGCNIWNKGIRHIAGNCNLPVLKSFPVVTKVCVQYVRRAEFYCDEKTLSLKEWLRKEWDRTGLPMYKTNEACGVVNAASRKSFTKDRLWYAPPPEIFIRMVSYANEYGEPKGRPYFSFDGKRPANQKEYEKLFPTFKGKYGVTNVWSRPPLHNRKRVRFPGSSKYAHLNQKPVHLTKLIIESSSNPGDVIWEPFGGLCTAGLVAGLLSRTAYCAEIDEHIYMMALSRLKECEQQEKRQSFLLEDLMSLSPIPPPASHARHRRGRVDVWQAIQTHAAACRPTPALPPHAPARARRRRPTHRRVSVAQQIRSGLEDTEPAPPSARRRAPQRRPPQRRTFVAQPQRRWD
jgi:site-specific DNA-methyltransferase (adenine-specific)